MTLHIDEKYSRQLPLIGVEGQQKLQKSKVAIIGLGGLGSLVSIYLTLAGIGELTIIDGDNVEPSNLNRQLLYDEASIGLPKAILAARRLKQYNSHVRIRYYTQSIEEDTNLEEIIGNTDLIIDALDNWKTRKIIGEYAYKNNIPIVHAAIDGFYGQLILLEPSKGYSIECIAPTRDKKKQIPSLGPAVGVIASLQALLAIQYLTNKLEETGILYILDLKRHEITKLKLAPCMQENK